MNRFNHSYRKPNHNFFKKTHQTSELNLLFFTQKNENKKTLIMLQEDDILCPQTQNKRNTIEKNPEKY